MNNVLSLEADGWRPGPGPRYLEQHRFSIRDALVFTRTLGAQGLGLLIIYHVLKAGISDNEVAVGRRSRGF